MKHEVLTYSVQQQTIDSINNISQILLADYKTFKNEGSVTIDKNIKNTMRILFMVYNSIYYADLYIQKATEQGGIVTKKNNISIPHLHNFLHHHL